MTQDYAASYAIYKSQRHQDRLSPATFGEFYDVVNLVQNLADCQGQRSLHPLVVGRQGTAATGSDAYYPANNSRYYTTANQPIGPYLPPSPGLTG